MQGTSKGQAQTLPIIPEGYQPEGVVTTIFAKETIYLLEHALPPRPGGLRIFAHLLYYGTVSPKTAMQKSLFEATGETQDEVIVLITSVEALAKSPGSPCGPETYLKILLILEKLKVIRR